MAMVKFLEACVFSMVAMAVHIRAQTAPCNFSLVTGTHGVGDHALTGPLPYLNDPRTHPKYARVYEKMFHAYIGPYLQVKLRKPSTVNGFVTQGRPGNGQYVKTYIVQYSSNGTLWHAITDTNGGLKIFTGNIDGITLSESTLSTPVTASYIRVTPTAWHNAPGLRLEIIGCPIHQHGLRQTCWKSNYVIEAPGSDMFSTTTINLGECGKECHDLQTCRAFAFNQRSRLCQGYNHTMFLNTTQSDGTTPNLDKLFPLFVKQIDCL